MGLRQIIAIHTIEPSMKEEDPIPMANPMFDPKVGYKTYRPDITRFVIGIQTPIA